MTERGSEPLCRKHIWVNVGDWEWVEATFRDSIGTSKAVRLMIRKFRSSIEAKASNVAKRPAAAAAASAAEET